MGCVESPQPFTLSQIAPENAKDRIRFIVAVFILPKDPPTIQTHLSSHCPAPSCTDRRQSNLQADLSVELSTAK